MISQVAVREAFHMLLLEYLLGQIPDGLILKGGANLRLFFKSCRYSQDMDLDAEPRLRDIARSAIRRGLTDPHLRKRLVALGINTVRVPAAPAKDTSTTLRYKLGVVTSGGIDLPTKVEVSFRARAPMDVAIIEAAPLRIPHYGRLPAIRQKVAALALRNQVQARDVFDLAVLIGGGVEPEALAMLRRELPDTVLAKASARALEIHYEEYRGTVIEYLGEEDQSRFGPEAAWDEQRLIVNALVQDLRALHGPTWVQWHPDEPRPGLNEPGGSS